MLFTTVRTCANHTSWQENSALDEKPCDVTLWRLSGRRYPHRSFAEL